MSTGTLELSRGTLTGADTINVSGLLTWTFGTLTGSGTTNANGGMNIAANGPILDGRTLDNAGLAVVTSSNNFFGQNGAVITNLASGTFDFQGNADVIFGGNGARPTFNNQGLLKKSAGTGDVLMSFTFNNTGDVNVDLGTLQLNGGGTSSGTYDIDSGATLRFGVLHTLTSTSAVVGQGNVVLEPGGGLFVTLAGNYSVTGTTTITGGATFNMASVTFPTLVQTGTLDGSANVAIPASGTLTISPAGYHGGSGTTTVAAGATLTINGMQLARNVVNQGNAIWAGGSVTLDTGGSFTNANSFSVTNAGGTFAAPFVNQVGAVVNRSTAGSSAFTSSFSNSGSVTVSSGTLSLSGTVAQVSSNTLTGGTWGISGSGILNLSGSNLTTIGSGASVTLNGPTATFPKLNTLTTNQGTFRLQNGRTFISSADFSNSGTLSVDATSKLQSGLTNQVSAWSAEGNANDSVGATTGTLQGGATAASAGRVGQAFSLDGVDDAVRMGDVLDNVFAGAEKKFSLALWVRIDQHGTATLISKLGDSSAGPENQRQFGLGLRPDGSLDFSYYGTLAYSSARLVRARTPLTTGTWYHVAATYDGAVDTANGLDRVKLYINGVEQSTSLIIADGTLGDIQNGTANLAIGASVASNQNAAYFFDGEIDEVGVYDRLLTAAEIVSLASADSFTQTSGTTSLGNGGVLHGGILKGRGTVGGDVENSNIVAPGNSPGIITIDGNYTEDNTAALNIEIEGISPNSPMQFDQLIVNGAVSLAGTLNTTLLNGFIPANGNSFQIICNHGTDPIIGSFATLPEGATFTAVAVSFRITYVGGDGNDVVQTGQGNVFTVTNTANSGAGSLHQAILDANAAVGFDLIGFNIAGAGVDTISTTVTLPTITGPLTINAYTQPSASANSPATGNNAVIPFRTTVHRLTVPASSAGPWPGRSSS